MDRAARHATRTASAEQVRRDVCRRLTDILLAMWLEDTLLIEFQPSPHSLEDAEWLGSRVGPVCMKHRSCLLDHIIPFAHRRLEEYEASLRYQLFDDAAAAQALRGIGEAMMYLSSADGRMRYSAFVAGEA